MSAQRKRRRTDVEIMQRKNFLTNTQTVCLHAADILKLRQSLFLVTQVHSYGSGCVHLIGKLWRSVRHEPTEQGKSHANIENFLHMEGAFLNIVKRHTRFWWKAINGARLSWCVSVQRPV